MINYSQEQYGEAEPLIKQALSIMENQLGDAHPDVAQSINNLAGLYQAQERYSEAEPLLRRALLIHKKHLGDLHLSMAINLNNLTELCHSLGRYEDAGLFCLEALSIRKTQLVKNHPDIAQSLNSLARLYVVQEYYGEAERLYLHNVSDCHEFAWERLSHRPNILAKLCYFLQQAIQLGHTAEPSNHPITQSLLQQIQADY